MTVIASPQELIADVGSNAEFDLDVEFYGYNDITPRGESLNFWFGLEMSTDGGGASEITSVTNEEAGMFPLEQDVQAGVPYNWVGSTYHYVEPGWDSSSHVTLPCASPVDRQVLEIEVKMRFQDEVEETGKTTVYITCRATENCTNNIDDDGNGDVDCADSSCFGSTECSDNNFWIRAEPPDPTAQVDEVLSFKVLSAYEIGMVQFTRVKIDYSGTSFLSMLESADVTADQATKTLRFESTGPPAVYTFAHPTWMHDIGVGIDWTSSQDVRFTCLRADEGDINLTAEWVQDEAVVATKTNRVRATCTESQTCPNGVAEGTEECDTEDLRGQTCESLGYDPGGVLECNGDCTLNEDGCVHTTTEVCNDWIDNDDDGLVDCEQPECEDDSECAPPPNVTAWIDDATGDLCVSREDGTVTYISPSIDIVAFGTLVQDQTEYQAENRANRSILECGTTSEIGTVVCPTGVQDWHEGELLTASMQLDGDVPLDDSGHSFIYSFVLESDGDPDDDWVYNEPWDWDYFQGADRWYQLIWNHLTSTWSLTVTQVDDLQNTTSDGSTVRALIDGDTVTFYIDMAEIPSDTPSYRFSAFGHDGYYSESDMGGDVSGANPTEPLTPI